MILELTNYLTEHFYTKHQLLALTKVSESEFEASQNSGFMPKASYVVKMDINCTSFFGLHTEDQNIEYYAKGYASWLATVLAIKDKEEIYAIFYARYVRKLEQLRSEGVWSLDPKINENLAVHIKQEWGHFLNGVYGLCTKSGLPEDIATKELAIICINELIIRDTLSAHDLEQLIRAVNLLDDVSSLFAPHERAQSSRHRLVNEVCRKFKLPVPNSV